MLEIGQVIEGTIETIAFGGEGILRYQGFVVFIPFTAVGDQILCRVTEVKRSYAKAILIELIRESETRTKPLCPYFGVCGGCQLQHLKHDAQLKYKLNSVTDALKRIGHLKFPEFRIIPATLNWSYRRHITLHLRPKNEGFEAGYIGQDHHSLVVIKTCPIFNTRDDPIIKQVQLWVEKIPNPLRQEGRLTILKNQKQQYILSFQFGHEFTIDQKIFQTFFQHSPFLSGVMIQTPKKTIAIGEVICEEKIEEMSVHFSPQTFIQNHPEQSLNIYKQICQIASQLGQLHILDLYCGFGVASLLLGRKGHSVTGIELNPDAIRFAKENADLNHIKNVHFIQGDVEEILLRWLNKNQVDFIMMNPPRHGLTKKIIKILMESSVQSLIYVSCMPSTLARDLACLSDLYIIEEGRVYDMFPQTAHVETLVYMKRKS